METRHYMRTHTIMPIGILLITAMITIIHLSIHTITAPTRMVSRLRVVMVVTVTISTDITILLAFTTIMRNARTEKNTSLGIAYRSLDLGLCFLRIDGRIPRLTPQS